MAGFHSPIHLTGSGREAVATGVQIGAIAALLGIGLAAAAASAPLPGLGLILAGGLGFTGLVALAVARYEAAVVLGFLLLGVVRIEPAPPDVVFAVVIAIAAVTGRFDLRRVPLVIFFTLGAFLALNVLSMVDAVDLGLATLYFSITLYLGVFALWLTCFIDSERRARLVLVAYLVGATASAIIGLTALLVGFPGSDELVFQDTRAMGLFKDANVFGPFMVPAVLFVVQELLRPRLLRFSAPTLLVMLLLLSLAVIFSFSRAAWLNLAVGMVVLFAVLVLRREGGARLAAVAATVAVAGIAVAGFVVATGSAEFLSERASLQNYDAERFAAQEAGIELAGEHPFGTGPGQYEEVVRYAAHSTYIRTFAEQGPMGLLSIIGLVLTTLVLAVRNAAIGRSAFGIGSAALLAAWTGLLVNSIFVDTLHWRHFWFLAGLIWLASMRKPEASGPDPVPGQAGVTHRQPVAQP